MTTIKINEQIAFLRKQKGLTQEELANALGVTNQAVSKWESAQCCPNIQLLPQIADYFGVTIDELMGHTATIHTTQKDFYSDKMFNNVLAILNEEGKISTSLLQRHLNIGYSKTKDIICELKENGYIESAGKWYYVLKK